MAHRPCVILACVILALTGCAGRGRVSAPPGMPSGPYVERGEACWYGREHHGKRTASGETFNRNKLTAAHRTLPFQTQVNVTNLSNGRRVVVRINDRGPFQKGRIIDVSEAAANQLGMRQQGIAPVEIRVVR